ncbi:MAG: glutaredoxin family protein [Porticoccaceae bacterium]|nr:glutaredoxin family protein [Porticoccaceae bacterium]MDG1474142.1 glutaredoxin family protein [Porticoccaceae bacterium]
MPKDLILYSSQDCHLCHQALQILAPLVKTQKIVIVEVDISSDHSLKERYALRIPVVMLPNGQEKGWPFTAAQISRMLSK